MKPLFLWATPVLFLIFLSCQTSQPPEDIDATLKSIDQDEFMGYLKDLSDDHMEGRAPGTPGYDSAASYVVAKLNSWGLKPGGDKDAYYQSISFRESRLGEGKPQFSITQQNQTIELEYEQDYILFPRAARTDANIEAEMVFIGYGVNAPDFGYNDYADIDIEGKVVLIMRGAPPSFGTVPRAVYSSGTIKAREAVARGAIGMIYFASNTQVRPWNSVVNYSRSSSLAWLNSDGMPYNSPPEIQINGYMNIERVKTMFQKVGRDFESVVEKLEQSESITFDLNVKAKIKALYEHTEIQSPNVVGIKPGSDPKLKNEYLVLTAHLDHLGIGKPLDDDSIYNGTLDNASGSAALLTLARLFSTQSPKRSMVFLWVTAEEKGLLGSDYYAVNPTVPKERIVANQNMDGLVGMMYRSNDLIPYGYYHSNISQAVDYATNKLGLAVAEDPNPQQNFFIRSDQYSFVKQGVPALFTFAGFDATDTTLNGSEIFNSWLANRYHKPNDDLEQPMDLEGIMQDLKYQYLVAHYLANEIDKVEWDTTSFLYQKFGVK